MKKIHLVDLILAEVIFSPLQILVDFLLFELSEFGDIIEFYDIVYVFDFLNCIF